MSNLILILICILLGALLRKIGRFPEATPTVLNAFVIHIALPAVALLQIHEMQINRDALYPATMAWIVFIVGAVFILAISKIFHWSKSTTGALILTAGLGNTSFVGFPLLEALYGRSALQIGVIADQAGSFLVLSTLGILTAAVMSSRTTSAQPILKRIFTFPPFLATALALILRPIVYDPSVITILDRLGSTLVPIALVSIGFQMNVRSTDLLRVKKPLVIGLFYKLILAPLLISALFVGIFGAHGEVIQVTIAESAMAPMITGAIIAEEYGLGAELSTLMVGIGIPLSLITVPLWAYLIRSL